MRIFLVVLLLFSTNSLAQKVETKSFVISLPDELTVQTNKTNRLLAFGKGNNPFVNIEFGKEVEKQFLDIVSRVNDTLLPLGETLKPVNCGDSCEGMFASPIIQNEGSTVYSYFYLARNDNHSFIITISSQKPIDSGELEISSLAKQILQKGT